MSALPMYAPVALLGEGHAWPPALFSIDVAKDRTDLSR